MGNYSYIISQEGCELDTKKLKKLCEERKIDHYKWAVERAEEEELDLKTQLGDVMSGWKIQGYWYEDYCRFLNACAECMSLTEDTEDNMIEMEEEQGYRFAIHFLKKGSKPVVKVGFVPMDFCWFEIRKDGSQKDVKE